VKRPAIPTGSPSPPPVDWTHFNPVDVFDSSSISSLVSNFPVAAAVDSEGEKVFLMARQHPASGCFDSGGSPSTNLIRIKRSLDQGAHWQDEQTVDVTGADGFVHDRDLPMLNFHITRDPRSSVTYVYAFYVRNELATLGDLTIIRNVLYSRSSLNGGKSWNGEVRVFLPPDPPQNGFADVPQNCDGRTFGFYRIGRVWSCVGDNGNVYVAWMDNRYGKYSGDTSKDYWQVFCSKSTDNGNTWSTTPFQVSGSSGDLSTASIGGFNNQSWVPPGDFLSCDADATNVYVSWPDSRDQQGDPTNPIKVYFRRIQF
jgi:hypothetical protein